jgi:hypothetical protein
VLLSLPLSFSRSSLAPLETFNASSLFFVARHATRRLAVARSRALPSSYSTSTSSTQHLEHGVAPLRREARVEVRVGAVVGERAERRERERGAAAAGVRRLRAPPCFFKLLGARV